MSGTAKTGRLPVDQATGRQELWLAIKSIPSEITVTAIVEQTGVNRTTVLRYLRALTAGEYLTATPGKPGRPNTWVLVNDVGHHAPRVRADGSPVTQGSITTQLWRAMTMLKEFDWVDLVHHASIEIPESTAKDYCKRLFAAGFLRLVVKADPSSARPARYRLIRATGPRAPQVQRVRQVYDPNTRTAHAVAGGTQ